VKGGWGGGFMWYMCVGEGGGERFITIDFHVTRPTIKPIDCQFFAKFASVIPTCTPIPSPPPNPNPHTPHKPNPSD
jgi:hypothetical protein